MQGARRFARLYLPQRTVIGRAAEAFSLLEGGRLRLFQGGTLHKWVAGLEFVGRMSGSVVGFDGGSDFHGPGHSEAIIDPLVFRSSFPCSFSTSRLGSLQRKFCSQRVILVSGLLDDQNSAHQCKAASPPPSCLLTSPPPSCLLTFVWSRHGSGPNDSNNSQGSSQFSQNQSQDPGDSSESDEDEQTGWDSAGRKSVAVSPPSEAAATDALKCWSEEDDEIIFDNCGEFDEPVVFGEWEGRCSANAESFDEEEVDDDDDEDGAASDGDDEVEQNDGNQDAREQSMVIPTPPPELKTLRSLELYAGAGGALPLPSLQLPRCALTFTPPFCCSCCFILREWAVLNTDRMIE